MVGTDKDHPLYAALPDQLALAAADRRGCSHLQIVPGRTNGMPLEVNFPFRLRSARYPTKYLGGTSQGDVFLTTSATAAEIRFNGPMLPL